MALSTLEQDELLGEVPFIEGSAVEVRYVAEAEGCALRELPASRLIEELTADTTFAGNVFRNIAITLSVKCEQICWRLEDMAVEASSMGWRANWRMRGKGRREKAKYAVSRREGRRLQELLGVPLDEELHHSTTSAFDSSMRVHGHLLVFSESIAFHSKVFGMTVKKVLPVSSIVTVLRDTPATRDVNDAIEVACMEDTFIFSEIPDLTETCEAVHEVITLASRHKRGSVNQTLELNQDAREAARQALSTAVKPREADGFEQRFQLAADDWLDFLQREAHCCVYAKGEVIVSQNQESDALFQIARGCVRVEKTTHLGDGTVVISRLGPPAVFGEFFFLMGARTRSLTSFVSDADGTELYIIKPDSLQPYLETKPMMPVCLYKYLAASMARKYRVLSATAGFGLIRSGDGFFDVPFDEIFENPVFLSLYARFLRSELPAKMPWLQFWQDADEFRTMPRGTFANKQGRSIFAQYVRADARLRIQLPAAIVEPIDAELSTRKDGEGRVYCIRSETFDAAQLEVFEGLRTHTYNKFVGSGFFGGVQELKAREKEVPAFHHFYYLKRLGTGSFGEVFAVRKKDSHRKYAMKVMSKQAQSEMSRRWAMYLQIECEVMAALSHPFLVNLNYAFQSAEVACMVLDLVSGGDMDAFQKRYRDAPPTEDVLRMMAAQLVCGLAYMHSVGIIHRDIKPPNLLLDEEGHLRITDFGLSLKLKAREVLYDRTGTKPYMAPELHLASKTARRGYGMAVDWYALGVTLWEIVSGGAQLPPPVSAVLKALRSGVKLDASHFSNLSKHDARASPQIQHMSDAARDFFTHLLAVDPARRLGHGTAAGKAGSAREIKEHPFFADVNYAAVAARRVAIPWGHDVMQELFEGRLEEEVAERKTAAQVLGSALQSAKLEQVPNFDFVSPRAVMEEYMENVYQLRNTSDGA